MTHGKPRSDDRSELSRTYQGYEGEYAERWSMANPGNRAILDERAAVLADLLHAAGVERYDGLDVLDLGAGSGESFPGTFSEARRLVRADLLFERLSVGRIADPGATLVCTDGTFLPFAEETFDVVVFATVLSSIPTPATRASLVSDAARVTRAGGAIVCYDFRVGNPRNHHTAPIGLRELDGLLPDCRPRTRTLTVAPPLARRLGGLTERLYPILGAVPALRTHRIAVWTRT